jgi:tetratricopeptide (TPR) repeat protein
MAKKQNKNLDFEISFFKKILKDDPDFIDALIPLAENYTKKGLYQEGLKVDQKLSNLRPLDPTVHYNLACSYSLTGEVKQSLETLKKSLRLGYKDFSWMEKDPDLRKIRKEKEYYEIIEKFREK